MSEDNRSERPVRILLQTTIPPTEDDWSIERFSLLRAHLASLTGETGSPLYEVVARDRESDANGDDLVLATLDRSDFDELWLFAVDTGNGLSSADCAGITRFYKRGGGILSSRDHQDLGSSLCTLGGLGAAHFFHSRNPELDGSRRSRDDIQTESISWPNYHSGSNGDFQRIQPVGPIHELLRDPGSSGVVGYFAASARGRSGCSSRGAQRARHRHRHEPHDGAGIQPRGCLRAGEGCRRKPSRPWDSRLELPSLRRLQLGYGQRCAELCHRAPG